jgi:pyruvate kinase
MTNIRRTKIVATLGPASSSRETIRDMILAGMDVARLNFSHGSYEEHARTISLLRAASRELDTPVTVLQDLQGPKIRVGRMPGGELTLVKGDRVSLLPEAEFNGQPAAIPIDYAHAAAEAEPGTRVLMADGLLELRAQKILRNELIAEVVRGGVLTSRKGVNFPSLNLRFPSLTSKDERDLEFGLSQGIDIISLSFVRSAEDVRALKTRISSKGVRKPVIAKIERPQGVANLEQILTEAQGVMVARGDLGVEMSPEKVPMLQKHIIEQCNRRGVPVITATQMLESMTQDAQPTRAEVSDVANAIVDGTDAVMLSGESAVGANPVQAVEMMARIAAEVESGIEFKSYPAPGRSEADALSEAVKALAQTIEPKCIVVFTSTGSAALTIAAKRHKAPVIALATLPALYHALNLVWGIRPLLIKETPQTAEALIALAASTVAHRGLASAGEKILVIGCVAPGTENAPNFLSVNAVG